MLEQITPAGTDEYLRHIRIERCRSCMRVFCTHGGVGGVTMPAVKLAELISREALDIAT